MFPSKTRDKEDKQNAVPELGIALFDSEENAFHIRKAQLINPESSFVRIWSVTIMVLLLYTATLMPYKISFLEKSSLGWTIIDTLIDLLFLADIGINLNTPYFDKKSRLVTRRISIFTNYLFGWLLIDLASSIPIDLVIQ